MARIISIAIIALFLMSSLSMAADTAKKPNFWQRLFSYPANVTKETAKVVTDAGTGSANAVVKEIKTGGEVSTGDVKKSSELVTEPIKNTVDVAAQAVKGTVDIPVKAAQECAASDTAAVK